MRAFCLIVGDVLFQQTHVPQCGEQLTNTSIPGARAQKRLSGIPESLFAKFLAADLTG
jgi:hypothetical protein